MPSPNLELSITLRASVTLTSGQPLSSFNLKYNSYASSSMPPTTAKVSQDPWQGILQAIPFTVVSEGGMDKAG